MSEAVEPEAISKDQESYDTGIGICSSEVERG